MSTKTTVRILIVDDSSNLRQVIRRYLEAAKGDEYHFEFEEALDGSEAERKLQEGLIFDQPIDIVFLDWMMPTMTGHQFLEKIRSIEVFSKKPSVIMLTAETNSEQINACLRYKVSKYIIKPFTQEMLTSVLLEVIAGRADGGVKYAV